MHRFVIFYDLIADIRCLYYTIFKRAVVTGGNYHVSVHRLFPSKTQSTFCVYASLSDNHTAFSMSSVLYQILSRLPFPKQNETTVSVNIKRIQEYLDPVSYKGIAKLYRKRKGQGVY